MPWEHLYQHHSNLISHPLPVDLKVSRSIWDNFKFPDVWHQYVVALFSSPPSVQFSVFWSNRKKHGPENHKPANCDLKNIFHGHEGCVSTMICCCCQAVNLNPPSEKGKEAFQLGLLRLKRAARQCFRCLPLCHESEIQSARKAPLTTPPCFFLFCTFSILLPSASSHTLSSLCVTVTAWVWIRGRWDWCV